MSAGSIHDQTVLQAHVRAATLMKEEPYKTLPFSAKIAAIAKHGGLYSLLDRDLLRARLGAFIDEEKNSAVQIAEKLGSAAANFFYRLVEKPGYTIHSDLMAFISEPGKGNGVTYNEGIQPSPDIPAAFTFVGQFIDHDLTFNGMNLDVAENEAVQDIASPVIDLDSVYGPRANVSKHAKDKIFDATGRFLFREINENGRFVGYDVPRHESAKDHNHGAAYIFDPRNDENQLILQIHILVQRLHNRLIDCGFAEKKLGAKAKRDAVIQCVRAEVVANWQSFILNEYMPKIIRKEVLEHILQQIKVQAGKADKPQEQYGDLKHKPYKSLVTGGNVVRMPHEFAIGFRFGHSQLRPMYLLNEQKRPRELRSLVPRRSCQQNGQGGIARWKGVPCRWERRLARPSSFECNTRCRLGCLLVVSRLLCKRDYYVH